MSKQFWAVVQGIDTIHGIGPTAKGAIADAEGAAQEAFIGALIVATKGTDESIFKPTIDMDDDRVTLSIGYPDDTRIEEATGRAVRIDEDLIAEAEKAGLGNPEGYRGVEGEAWTQFEAGLAAHGIPPSAKCGMDGETGRISQWIEFHGPFVELEAARKLQEKRFAKLGGKTWGEC